MAENAPFCVVSLHVAILRNILTPAQNKDSWYISKPKKHNFTVLLNKRATNFILAVCDSNLH
jgi:hypothetical protein